MCVLLDNESTLDDDALAQDSPKSAAAADDPAVWEVYLGDQGAWRPFDPSVSVVLENARSAGKSQVVTLIRGHQYTVQVNGPDDSTLKQRNEIYGIERPVRRRQLNPPAEVLEVANETEAAHAAEEEQSAAEEEAAAAAQAAGGEWTCEICTCINARERLQCEACESPAPTEQIKQATCEASAPSVAEEQQLDQEPTDPAVEELARQKLQRPASTIGQGPLERLNRVRALDISDSEHQIGALKATRLPPRDVCLTCNARFDNRSQLFRHLRQHSHGVPSKPISEFLTACSAGDWERAHWMWDLNALDPNTSNETCETALHLLVKQFCSSSSVASPLLKQQLSLAGLLVQAGADFHAVSRPDSIWGIREMDGTPYSPVQLARASSHPSKNELLRVLFGYDADAPLCECCGDEFFMCCNSLDPPFAACGHRCCTDTTTGWIISQASSGAQLATIGCPVCLVPIGEGTASSYLKRAGASSTLEQLLRRSVEAALVQIPGFVWCPRCVSGGFASLDCDKAVCADCGYQFCSKCKHSYNGHLGLTCEDMQNSDTGKTMAWVEEHTRQCPKCAVGIEYDGGCSHMTCRMCKHNFCWLCMGTYKDKYTMDPTKVMDKAIDNNKQHIDKGVRCPCGNVVKVVLFNRTR